jgi:uncharacterized glyoxalase superfamily protein PhnB
MAPEPVVFDQINLVVRDMEATVAFYELLGVSVPDTEPGWQAHHRKADLDGTSEIEIDSTAFAPTWMAGWGEDRTGVVVGLRTASRDDVDAHYAAVTGAGHTGLQPPFDAFWGARYAIVEDPSGIAVGLMSPVDPGRRTPPPDPPAS